MIFAPATHYQHFIANGTPVVIEGGKPIIVHGIVFSDVSANAQLLIFEKDGVTPIVQPYVDNSFGDNPTNELCAPFLAQNGLLFQAAITFLDPATDPTDVNVTVFYSHIGA